MGRIGLIDIGSKIGNLALMKLSTYHKGLGDTVVLDPSSPNGFDRVYVSTLFTRDRVRVERLLEGYRETEFVVGGSGWDVHAKLPDDIEQLNPDYEIYTVGNIYKRLGGPMRKATKMAKAQEIATAGIGFTSRGCTRLCPFCLVWRKEGDFHKVREIKDLINPKSSRVFILDNNFTADPDVIEKLKEIKERKLTVEISQGIDIRTITPDIAQAISEVSLYGRRLHYAWDLLSFENQVLKGIKILSRFVNTGRHRCFMLCGYNTSFEEDWYRFRKLIELGVKPYVMLYENDKTDARRFHFMSWINGFYFTVCDFNDYGPWVSVRDSYFGLAEQKLFAA